MARNLLGDETSPYLLQHKDNPVHWRPWGVATLEEAQRSDRPILLSVGYAACHWCHVMAHESFENPEIAGLMNELFINVKVDREERPDIDAIYQSSLAMLGEHGGWPLTMFLTPRGEPFWGGTYFPPAARFGRPGFPDVLRQVANVYHAQKDKVAKNVAALHQGLTKMSQPEPGNGLTPELIDEAAAMALRLVDPIRGGTAGAPKFPQPVYFRLLWRAYRRTHGSMFREAVTLSLDEMCKGGIYDHLGGGFARYATDVAWLIPHFEKMLYDNALVVELLTEAWLHTRSPLYARRVEETLAWAMAELAIEHPSGDGTFAFASALDADSEGVEGKFYVWTSEEVDAELGALAARFIRIYDVRPHGNWEDHNILNLTGQPNVAALLDDPDLAEARQLLKTARDRRVRPGRDDKILADWNGLMVTALVAASTAFQRPQWLEAAQRAFDFVTRHMQNDQGRLLHTWCAGEARHPAILEDYANLARAAVALAEATGADSYLTTAAAWADVAARHYWDSAAGGYFTSADDTTDVLVRVKNITDNAVPSGNGTMVEVLTRLYLLTGERAYRERAEALITLFSSDSPQYLMSVPGLLIGAELLMRPVQVVIAGDPSLPATRALRHVVEQSVAAPSIIVSQTPDGSLPDKHPAHGKTAINGAPAAYVCIGQSCSMPLTDPEVLRRHLTAA